MPWKQEAPVWEPEEYPKALNAEDSDGKFGPVHYPSGHAKAGLPVVFESADEEAAYGK